MYNNVIDISMIEKLLFSVEKILLKNEEESRKTGTSFNIFEIANISTKETIICRILAELLSPKGTHGQNSAFLKRFLHICLGITEFSKNEIENAFVKIEHRSDDKRRIDLVIEISHSVIPIEVKINAGDSDNQCYDYLKATRKIDENAKLVYLSITGDYPPKNSMKRLTKDDVIPISFSEHIMKWLISCLDTPDMEKKELVKAIIIQLMSTIKLFSNQLEDKPMHEIIDILKDSPQQMKNAKAISDAFESYTVIMKKKFYDAFCEQFDTELIRIEADSPMYLFEENVFPDISVVFNINEDNGVFARLGFIENGGNTCKADKKIVGDLKKRYNINWGNSNAHISIWYERFRFAGKVIPLYKIYANSDNYFDLFDSDKFDKIVGDTVNQAKIMLSKLQTKIIK